MTEDDLFADLFPADAIDDNFWGSECGFDFNLFADVSSSALASQSWETPYFAVSQPEYVYQAMNPAFYDVDPWWIGQQPMDDLNAVVFSALEKFANTIPMVESSPPANQSSALPRAIANPTMTLQTTPTESISQQQSPIASVNTQPQTTTTTTATTPNTATTTTQVPLNYFTDLAISSIISSAGSVEAILKASKKRTFDEAAFAHESQGQPRPILHCKGTNVKRGTRCKNVALMEYIGPQPHHCAEHIHLDPEAMHHKCRFSIDGKRQVSSYYYFLLYISDFAYFALHQR
jgi:hypothetical protein